MSMWILCGDVHVRIYVYVYIYILPCITLYYIISYHFILYYIILYTRLYVKKLTKYVYIQPKRLKFTDKI